MKYFLLTLFAMGVVLATGCDNGAKNENQGDWSFMEGAQADCAFDVLTFTTSGGAPVEVSINGLPVEELPGVNKLTVDTFEVVTRRGVRFSEIFARAGFTAGEDTPVNCIARDGYDILRGRLNSDTSKLPTFGVLRDHGYVYVGSPGDKDPLYPQMEGRSLMVDYDITEDAAVPANLGGTVMGMNQYRFKMVEKVDEQQRGLFEIDPVVER